MKPRHAAALVLVGWYLLVPPPQAFKNSKYYQVPLGEWTHKATFDSESECKQEIRNGCHSVDHGDIFGFEGPYCHARCVASDDPRLKGN
jgi:hypothetical protein